MRCNLARLLGEVLERIYREKEADSVNAPASVNGLALDQIMQLDAKLTDWESKLPEFLRAPLEGLDASHTHAARANILRQK